MKEKIKEILKTVHIYHPLQSFYRTSLQLAYNSYTRYAYAKLKGSGFKCNVCQSSYKKFVNRFPSRDNSDAIKDNQVVAGYGYNILCPNCLSTARERLVLAMLSTFDLQDKNILHFSPEKNISKYLKRFANVVSADLMPGFYKTTDKTVVKADATRLSFADASFDLVIANHIMEHIPDDITAMREIYRVLKPGGESILQIPYSTSIPATLEQPFINDPQQQSVLYGQKDHVRIYALHDYVARLESVGFIVEIIPYTELRHLYVNAIQKDECFLHITKPTS